MREQRTTEGTTEGTAAAPVGELVERIGLRIFVARGGEKESYIAADLEHEVAGVRGFDFATNVVVSATAVARACPRPTQRANSCDGLGTLPAIAERVPDRFRES